MDDIPTDQLGTDAVQPIDMIRIQGEEVQALRTWDAIKLSAETGQLDRATAVQMFIDFFPRLAKLMRNY